MKRATLAAAALLTVGGLFGCNDNKKMSDMRTNGSVTDITAPAPSPSAYQPVVQPVAAQPAAQPLAYETMTPQATPAISSNGNYTVKKGDTLYSIARQRYGDGKQWTKITSANPGLKPETLKVGQTIVIP